MTTSDLRHIAIALLLVVNAFAMPWAIGVMTENEDALCAGMPEGMRNLVTLRSWRLCP